MDGDQVVGSAQEVNDLGHARLWYREGDTWVCMDLHPPGLNERSTAFAVDGGEQVGIVLDNDPYCSNDRIMAIF